MSVWKDYREREKKVRSALRERKRQHDRRGKLMARLTYDQVVDLHVEGVRVQIHQEPPGFIGEESFLQVWSEDPSVTMDAYDCRAFVSSMTDIGVPDSPREYKEEKDLESQLQYERYRSIILWSYYNRDNHGKKDGDEESLIRHAEVSLYAAKAEKARLERAVEKASRHKDADKLSMADILMKYGKSKDRGSKGDEEGEGMSGSEVDDLDEVDEDALHDVGTKNGIMRSGVGREEKKKSSCAVEAMEERIFSDVNDPIKLMDIEDALDDIGATYDVEEFSQYLGDEIKKMVGLNEWLTYLSTKPRGKRRHRRRRFRREYLDRLQPGSSFRGSQYVEDETTVPREEGYQRSERYAGGSDDRWRKGMDESDPSDDSEDDHVRKRNGFLDSIPIRRVSDSPIGKSTLNETQPRSSPQPHKSTVETPTRSAGMLLSSIRERMKASADVADSDDDDDVSSAFPSRYLGSRNPVRSSQSSTTSSISPSKAVKRRKRIGL